MSFKKLLDPRLTQRNPLEFLNFITPLLSNFFSHIPDEIVPRRMSSGGQSSDPIR
jgi:hypothetical protein